MSEHENGVRDGTLNVHEETGEQLTVKAEAQTPSKKTKAQKKEEKARIKRQKAEKKREEKLAKKQAKWAKQRRLTVPANKKGRHILHEMNFLRRLFYPVHRFFYPFKMYGFTKAPDGAFIYVGNHYCLWDVFYPAHTTWEVLHFLSKQSILEAPVIGRWARKFGVIGAMRDGSDVRTVMESIKVLKNGEKISMFPEGTRNKQSDEEFLPFRAGAAMLAIKTKTPIIPFVICNRPKVFRRTHVVFGEPLELSEYYDRKLTSEDYTAAEEEIKQRLYAMRAEFRAQRAAKKKKKRKTK